VRITLYRRQCKVCVGRLGVGHSSVMPHEHSSLQHRPGDCIRGRHGCVAGGFLRTPCLLRRELRCACHVVLCDVLAFWQCLTHGQKMPTPRGPLSLALIAQQPPSAPVTVRQNACEFKCMQSANLITGLGAISKSRRAELAVCWVPRECCGRRLLASHVHALVICVSRACATLMLTSWPHATALGAQVPNTSVEDGRRSRDAEAHATTRARVGL
jgi:hypothetical protein